VLDIRPASTDADLELLISVRRRVDPDVHPQLANLRHFLDTTTTGTYLLARAGGEAAGCAFVDGSADEFAEASFEVVPERRGRGVGGALLRAVSAHARSHGYVRLRLEAKEDDRASIAFLERRGFRETKRDWESRLPVHGFDFARFAGAEPRVAREGIRITTLAEERARDPKALEKAYDLAKAIQVDIPTNDPITMVPFETWRALVIEGPASLPDAYFVAVDRSGSYVGLSDMSRSIEDPSFLWHGLTGVRREWRGKGVAMALKLRTVRYAQERGVDHIKTWNDTRNRPMLAINEALGFVKQPVWIEYQKELVASG
jgi:GNAT superfamily N-acetyltransferase